MFPDDVSTTGRAVRGVEGHELLQALAISLKGLLCALLGDLRHNGESADDNFVVVRHVGSVEGVEAREIGTRVEKRKL